MESQDAPDREIAEEDLYRYTRHRWLFNEDKELSKRYVRFNIQQLIIVAVNVCDGAGYCTKITKCSEVFAKLPNPNAGPARFTVASEVATREMLRDVFNIPVPRILAWSFDAATSPVEAEYIIEEKAPGVRLGSVWNRWPRNSKLQLIKQVADMEDKLTSVSFDGHGCIYLKDDLHALAGANFQPIACKDLKRFVIGPLTTNELWSGTRKHMSLDRGPWRNSCEYTRALGQNEITWIESQAAPRMNYYRSNKEQELPRDALALLAKYMDVASHLVPQSTDESASANVLWHPDLHLDNIFVDPDTHQITRIVDWQSACVAPLFYQSGVPRVCRHPGPVQDGWVIPERPDNFDNLSEDDRKRIDDDIESETIYKYYEAQVCKRAPRHWDILQKKSVPIIRKPVWLVTGAWENRDLFFFARLTYISGWTMGELFPDVPCPIDFDSQDIELHCKESENIDGVGQMLKLFRDQGILPVDGMVEPKDYSVAVENSRKFKEIFIGLAKDEEERELYSISGHIKIMTEFDVLLIYHRQIHVNACVSKSY